MAGIGAGAPGFARLRCALLMDVRLGDGHCRHDTAQGPVQTAWGVAADASRWLLPA